MTANLISDIGEKRDIPVILDGVSMRDDYDGDFNQRRVLYYTLTFTAKTYLFGLLLLHLALSRRQLSIT